VKRLSTARVTTSGEVRGNAMNTDDWRLGDRSDLELWIGSNFTG
jgi:hypothetical protein